VFNFHASWAQPVPLLLFVPALTACVHLLAYPVGEAMCRIHMIPDCPMSGTYDPCNWLANDPAGCEAKQRGEPKLRPLGESPALKAVVDCMREGMATPQHPEPSMVEDVCVAEHGDARVKAHYKAFRERSGGERRP